MKNLIIIRHAKSSWDTAFKDIDRPLAVRGVKDAHLVSSSVFEYLPKSFIIWSSVAKRASETALIFCQNWFCPEELVVLKEELYVFDRKQLEKIIKSCDNQFDHLIVFGHNEAITTFVNKFGDVPIENVPTTGFVSIIFKQTNWQKINNGKTNKIIFPRDLKL